jgi:hypothetical protein
LIVEIFYMGHSIKMSVLANAMTKQQAWSGLGGWVGLDLTLTRDISPCNNCALATLVPLLSYVADVS